jgi:hypothetical protein
VAGGSYTFRAELWEHDGEGAWHFLSLPPGDADDIEASAAGARRGFGSVRVEVTVGSTTWRTSLFPDKGRATYVLPVKRAVRDAEAIAAGSTVAVRLRVVE